MPGRKTKGLFVRRYHTYSCSSRRRPAMRRPTSIHHGKMRSPLLATLFTSGDQPPRRKRDPPTRGAHARRYVVVMEVSSSRRHSDPPLIAALFHATRQRERARLNSDGPIRLPPTLSRAPRRRRCLSLPPPRGQATAREGPLFHLRRERACP